MRKNVLFRGCTRPAMFLGVPYMPFFIVVGGTFLLAIYTNLAVLFAIPVEVFVMRQMARRDEMIFRLIGLRLQFKLRVRNVREHEGLWVFTPNAYRKNPPRD
ncbi:type IV secretion system protein VirB3 [Xanthomonas arboricola]|uniref:type IV secretion system protein VirB3 n=1 Tax=Xanthomonas campestris TaxID=339 RepID=UPI00216A1C88|nr:VirB3 family type IV secretion system protein [Xanthomonas campestris]MCS3848995.1 type IV secretion system protein VirB3 [Xanthomonas campestris]MCW2005006.1 type IV secretion system protein VirB3 [Xanthomonas campestris]